MMNFEQLIQAIRFNLPAASEAEKNNSKVEIEALKMLHTDLFRASILAADVAKRSGCTDLTFDHVLVVNQLLGVYSSAALNRLVRSGDIVTDPLPVMSPGAPAGSKAS